MSQQGSRPTGAAAPGQGSGTGGAVEEFMAAYRAWGAAPTVAGYMKLFTPDGTLMDSGLGRPIGYRAIERQMEAVLTVVPDYRFDPFAVTVQDGGRVILVTARNTGTVTASGPTGPTRPAGSGESRGPSVAVDYLTRHRLLLRGPRVEQGRRYWDQTELFRPLSPGLPGLVHGLGPGAVLGDARPGRSHRRRQDAWNARDAAALVAGLPESVRLTGPGLDRPLIGRDSARAYLERFFSATHTLELTPGHRVHEGSTTFQEWVGGATVGPERRPVRYGVLERLTQDASGATEWELSFDTLDLVASATEIDRLRALLFG
ncbi:nuclear transport factor 2 family protein [Streptomyces sp. NPDC057638]|uniref:nuclear transport factor 2 family protein n=1 Tax=Streptomyces sp. NPDC057638 TaxID=3346190 RepID=UPI00369F7C57